MIDSPGRKLDDLERCIEGGIIIDDDEFGRESTLTEKVMLLAAGTPSSQAVDIGKLLYVGGFSDDVVGLAERNMDSFGLADHEKNLAVQLLKVWANGYMRGSFPPEYAVKSELDSLFRGMKGLVCTKVMQEYAEKLLMSRSVFVHGRNTVASDLSSLGTAAYRIFPKLPADVQRIFFSVVDKVLAWNEGAKDEGELRRYNTLGNIVESFAAFTRKRYHPKAHRLVRKLVEKDTKLILYPLYGRFASVRHDAPDYVIEVLARAMDFLPEGRAMIDDEVRDLSQFVGTINDSLRRHDPEEIDCFFRLYHKILKHTEHWAPFMHLDNHLRVSTAIRDSGRGRSKIPNPSTGIDDAGLDYLQLSWDIKKESMDSASKNAWISSGNESGDFTSYVRSLAHLELDSIRRAMDLYRIGIIQEDHLAMEPASELGIFLIQGKKTEQDQRELDEIFDQIVSEGPDVCPDNLHDHLKSVFKVGVDEIWDLREYQALLYYGAGAALTYNLLSSKKIDPAFLSRVVSEMGFLQMLEREQQVLLGGCGFGNTELLFIKELVLQGYCPVPRLYDESRMMLDQAMGLFRQHHLEPYAVKKDLKALEASDFHFPGQTLLTVFGGTWLNFPDRRLVASAYQRILSDNPEREAFRLIIQGDTEKDQSYYERRLAKLFLARGLHRSCRLDLESLMMDGRLCHTSYFDPKMLELQCIYLITHDQGPFRAGQAIRVIDSGTLHKKSFCADMERAGYDSHFIYGPNDSAVAVCSLK